MTQSEKAEFLLRHYTLEYAISIADTKVKVAIADDDKKAYEYWGHVLFILENKNPY